MKKALFLLLLAVFSLLTVGSSLANSTIPDSTDYLLIGEKEARLGMPEPFFLQKALTISEQLSRLYGGDLRRGCPLDSITAIIIGGSKSHDDECERAAKSMSPKVKVTFFPWDIPGAKEVAEYLEVALILPISTSETIGWNYVPQEPGRDVMLFVSLAFWDATDNVKTFYERPKELSKYSICTTVGDSTGVIIGPVGPNVDFVGYWPNNYRSFIICQTYSCFEYVRERADNMGIELTYKEARNICYTLASSGSIDSLGRRESFCGMIDISNSAKVDSVIFVFETQKRFAAVSAPAISPEKFFLAQNYPNPFNPTTTIAYKLAKSGPVQLTVYNMAGQIVATLVNETQQAGEYKIQWDGTSQSSGIYLCRLRGDGFYVVKQMTLLR